jgi:hypothetical protein
MFDELRLLGSTERRIVVQTRRGTSLRNLVELEPGFPERQKYQLLLKRYGGNWIERKPPTGAYNCAGHVWASRRTALLEEADWRTILEEDDYRRLGDAERPAPGDLVLYINTAAREILHVGMILELRPGIGPDSTKIPWILSKWNSTSGEVLHWVSDVPYNRQGFPVRIEYWTDRPAAAESLR